MTDKKLTDEEIIKRLERCVKRGNRNYDTDIVLDLIKRQQSEIENLKVENQSLRSAANSLKMHYEEAQAEIERLKEKQEKCFYCTEQANKKISEIKAEAYKEFAEKAKEIMHKYCGDITEDDLDNLAKEMAGENNEE